MEDGSASLGAASAIGWSAAGVTFNRDRHSNVPRFPQYVAGGSQPIPRVQNYVTFTDPASVALTTGRYINTSASHYEYPTRIGGQFETAMRTIA